MVKVPMYLRCHVENHKEKGKFTPENQPKPSNSIVLAFDTETNPDESKNLVFGSCGIWINGKLSNFYVFYSDDLKDSSVEKLQRICSKLNVTLLPRTKFVERVFYPYVYKARAKCVGFNLPFDISRLATYFTKSRRFHNGFSFRLSDNKKIPDIVIKSLDGKSQFIEFTRPVRSNSEKKKPHYKGCFVDCKTFTFALTNNSYTLEKALDDFGCTIKKSKAEKHGIISDEYIRYNINDTLATYSLYLQCMKRYSLYSLNKSESKLFSPASIGKGYLEKIGIKPFSELNQDFPKEILGYTMMSYYGGRTEAKIRAVSTPVSYVDFTSMYPTVFVLLDMYRFLIAKKITHQHTTKEIQKFLKEITLGDVAKPNTWKNFATICRIIPDDDVLPVRSDYGHKNTTNIGINYLKSTDGTSIWYALPDLIASKFLSGKTPKIEEAITFSSCGIQEGLQEIKVLKGISVKPEEDFIKKIIEERMRTKRLQNLSVYKQKQAELNQNILKIIANATSYGIFIQIDTTKQAKKRKVLVHGLETFDTESDKIENIGAYFNPIMSVFLTASSRLILATSESLVEENGGYVVYCDTDSVFVSPDHVRLVQEFFKSLNPYCEEVEMFKVEKDKDTGKLLDNVKCIAISAKRYVLYDYDETSGDITIYKYSSHGLGHLKGIDNKQVWNDIIMIHHHPEIREKFLLKYQNKFAISQLTITNYDILKRFDEINKKRPYSKKIKPYNFATVGTACRADPATKEPIIPFLSEMGKLDEIPYMEFLDYKTGKKYPNDDSLESQHYWKDLESVLDDYIEHKESKLDGTKGVLKRKHLTINKNSIRYIGKESNELEKSDILGVTQDDTNEYVDYQKKLRETIANLTEENLKTLGFSRRTYFYLKNKIRKNKIIRLHRKTSNALNDLIFHYSTIDIA